MSVLDKLGIKRAVYQRLWVGCAAATVNTAVLFSPSRRVGLSALWDTLRLFPSA